MTKCKPRRMFAAVQDGMILCVEPNASTIRNVMGSAWGDLGENNRVGWKKATRAGIRVVPVLVSLCK